LWITGTGGDLRKAPSLFDTLLPDRFTLLAYDHRGCGRSHKPDQVPSMADFADDAAALLDAMGWARAHVIGYSFGAMVAQHLALRHPDRIERLVLAAATPGGAGGAAYPLHALGQLEPRARAIAIMKASDTRMTGLPFDDPDLALEARIEAAMQNEAAFMDEPGARQGRAHQLAARAQHSCWNELANIRHEALVCGGIYDGVAPRESVKNLAHRLPNATLRWYAGGHHFLAECPEFFADSAAFLDGKT
jgi:3-oxoadipate enol-lactonase